MRLTLALLFLPAALAAQSPDSTRGIPLPVTDSALRLPGDRAGDLLSWLPGGTLDADGRPAWRGHAESDLGRSIDGVFWASIVRPSRIGAPSTPRTMTPAFNALGPSTLLTGAYDVAAGGAGPGLMAFTTLSGGEHWVARGSAESGAFARPDGGDASSRFEVSAGGPLGMGWRLRVAATALGRESAPAGIGYGDAPYYAPVALDTTYSFEQAPGDTVTAVVQNFAPASRVPTSPRTSTDLATRIDGRLGTTEIWVHYLRATDAERFFSYVDQSNPAQSFGADARSQDLAVGLRFAPVAGWRLGGQLSWQEERTQEGPIDPAHQLETRNPGLGLLTGGAGLRYTLATFPVDDDLIWNYRLSIAGSRRSPYDLENTSQYSLVDLYRNNAYGVLGFDETGGPIGTLTLLRDSRVGGQVTGTKALGRGTLTAGIEARLHDIASYSSSLVSQAFSDAWRSKPIEQGAFASWTAAGPTWSFTGGLRLDRFNSEARRPKAFPRIASFNGYWIDSTNGDTLRRPQGTLDRETWWESISDHDQWHSVVSPRLAADGDLGDQFHLHASAGRFARTPDLSLQLAGVNTDLALTNYQQVFGSDYGQEITDLLEGGVARPVGRGSVGLTAFRQHHVRTHAITSRLLFDPAKNTDDLLYFNVLRDGATENGITLDGTYQLGPAVVMSGAYTYISSDASADPLTGFVLVPADDSIRHHTLTLMARVTTPGDGPAGGIGAIVTFRRASGAARMVDPGFGPTLFGLARTDGVPAWSSLDLRVTKAFSVGRSRLTMYVDGRNLLNAKDLLRAFWAGNPEISTVKAAAAFAADSTAWAAEASRNGVDNAGTIDLSFGRAACGFWTTASGVAAPPNCAYLIQAESRFGNGDGLFTPAEQRRASGAYYLTQFGAGAFNGPPRAIRIGAQLGL